MKFLTKRLFHRSTARRLNKFSFEYSFNWCKIRALWRDFQVCRCIPGPALLVHEMTVSSMSPVQLLRIATASSCVTSCSEKPFTARIWSPRFSRPSAAAAPCAYTKKQFFTSLQVSETKRRHKVWLRKLQGWLDKQTWLLKLLTFWWIHFNNNRGWV